MLAEVIAIGDELTCGQRLDTNSQWLSQRLDELGVTVRFHTTVGDDLAANIQVFRHAIERADIVVCTGGLGPTADDLTRQSLAKATGVGLVEDADALAHIIGLYAKRGRKMPEKNKLQALFPEGASQVFNPNGTAPGIAMTIARGGDRPPCHFFALPGVPAETKEMWVATVGPAVESLQIVKRITRHRRLKCFGAGESQLEAMLPDLIRRGRVPQVGITASKATITLRVTATAEDPAACDLAMEPTLATMRELLGLIVFGEEDDELQDVVIRLLTKQNATMAVADAGTNGLLMHWLAEADPQRKHFSAGEVPNLVRLGTCTEESLSQRASELREQHEADYGLITGPVLPGAGEQGATATVALASEHGTWAKTYPAMNHPAIMRQILGKQALDLLRLHLLRD